MPSLPEPCSKASALRQSGSGSSTLTTRGPVPTKERRISWGSSLGLTSRWINPAGTWKNPPVSTCVLSRPPGPNSNRARPRMTWPSTSRSPWWCQPDAMPPSARARTRIARGVSKAISRTSPGVDAAGARPSALTARIPRCLTCEAKLQGYSAPRSCLSDRPYAGHPRAGVANPYTATRDGPFYPVQYGKAGPIAGRASVSGL